MKYATLNVYEIKMSLNEYVTFKNKLHSENNKLITICADINFDINFMNKSLLSKEINLYKQLNIVLSIIARNIFDEKIINKRMHLII